MGAFGSRSTYTDAEAVAAIGAHQAFAYDGTTQAIAVADTFQDLDYATNGELSGWTHTGGSADFTCQQTGKYLVSYMAMFERSIGGGSDEAVCIVDRATYARSSIAKTDRTRICGTGP